MRLIRVPGQPVPDRESIRTADSGQPGGQLGERVLGRRHDNTGPPGRSRYLLAQGQDRQQPRPQQRRLPRPRRPGDHHHAFVAGPVGQLHGQLRGQPLPPVEHPGVGLAERQQPSVGASPHPPRDTGRPAVPGRQHLLGGTAATGRRHERRPGRPVQAERLGQEFGGVLAGGTVDASLQVADRPRAQVRRIGQLLLGQPRLGPQLPQQPAETLRSLLRHLPSIPSRCQLRNLPSGYAPPGTATSEFSPGGRRDPVAGPVARPVGRYVW